MVEAWGEWEGGGKEVARAVRSVGALCCCAVGCLVVVVVVVAVAGRKKKWVIKLITTSYKIHVAIPQKQCSTFGNAASPSRCTRTSFTPRGRLSPNYPPHKIYVIPLPLSWNKSANLDKNWWQIHALLCNASCLDKMSYKLGEDEM